MIEKAPVILPLMNQRRWVSDQKDGASTIQTSERENALDAKRTMAQWRGSGGSGLG